MREITYVALGDSTAVGVGARTGGGYPDRLLPRLRRLRPQLRLVNLGESGATSSDVLRTQVPRALRQKPALVTIAVGINDVGLQIPEEAFARNLEEIVIALNKLSAPTALANLPDLAHSPAVSRLVPTAYYERRLELYNKHVEATAARHGLLLLDLWRISRETLPDHPEYFSPDGFHPSAEGYEAWAEGMEPEVASLLTDTRSNSRMIP